MNIYSCGHFSEHCVNILGKIYLLIVDTLWLDEKKENIHIFNWHIYFNMKFII